MKNHILSYLLGWFFVVLLWLWLLWWAYVNADKYCYEDWECFESDIDPAIVTACDWIELNTDFPIIWNCIHIKNVTGAFPTMIWALTKIIISIILVVCFIMVIVAWIMRASSWDKESGATKAKWLIMKVAITILLLWFSWVILKLINPNFFS